MIKQKIKTKVYQTIKEHSGRYLIVDISINQDRFILCNVYVPNEDKPDFFVEMFSNIDKVNKNNTAHVIIGGDFNTVLEPLHKIGGATETIGHVKSVEVIKDFCASKNLLDIWQVHHSKD